MKLAQTQTQTMTQTQTQTHTHTIHKGLRHRQDGAYRTHDGLHQLSVGGLRPTPCAQRCGGVTDQARRVGHDSHDAGLPGSFAVNEKLRSSPHSHITHTRATQRVNRE